MAQVIDYAACVEGLSSEKIVQIYAEFATKYGIAAKSFDDAFKVRVGVLNENSD